MSSALTTETQNSVVKDESSLFLGLVVCWLLNMAHLGVSFLLFAYGEGTLPTVVVLVAGIGLLQIAYVVPVWYVLRRRGRKKMAKGMAIAAIITALVNAALWGVLYVNG